MHNKIFKVAKAVEDSNQFLNKNITWVILGVVVLILVVAIIIKRKKK